MHLFTAASTTAYCLTLLFHFVKSFVSVNLPRPLCQDILKTGSKIQNLSERMARLDLGKVYNLSPEESQILHECGLSQVPSDKCPNFDIISNIADR